MLAGRTYGIPVQGTHAHSWVMAFEDELTAFRRFAEIYKERTILLVDTYDTLGSGIPNAIRTAREMEKRGKSLFGVRLDSGDMAVLSREARRMLDEAGLGHVRIVCSGDLDEWAIRDLGTRGARIDLYGVGTSLVTARGDPALTGVYKLAAIRDKDDRWSGRAKISDERRKSSLPGIKQVFRLSGPAGEPVADWIELEGETPDLESGVLGVRVMHEERMELIHDVHLAEPLLKPLIDKGRVKAHLPTLGEIRGRVRAGLARLPAEVRRLDGPRDYDVLVGPRLWGHSPTR
jgi:nicotinate phosphoribosyltransferase